MLFFFLSDIVLFHPVPLLPLEFRAHSLADRKTQQLHVASHVLVRPFSRDSLMDGRFQSKLLPYPPPPAPAVITQAAAGVCGTRQRQTAACHAAVCRGRGGSPGAECVCPDIRRSALSHSVKQGGIQLHGRRHRHRCPRLSILFQSSRRWHEGRIVTLTSPDHQGAAR